MMPIAITAGLKVNQLTALEVVPHYPKRGEHWRCQCDCGGERIVRSTYLRDGSAISCGCAMAQSKRTHGRSRTPEFRSWESAKARCYLKSNKRYPLYGGRGITMCEAWKASFAVFFADMGPRPSLNHSLDRIDNDRGYEPGNCRWATPEEQNNNRSSFNRHLIVENRRMTVAQAARLTGIPHATILGRLDAGATDAEAIRNG